MRPEFIRDAAERMPTKPPLAPFTSTPNPLPPIWEEIKKQMEEFDESDRGMQSPSTSSYSGQRQHSEASWQSTQPKSNDNRTPSISGKAAVYTPSGTSNLPSNVIEAFQKGDLNALREALGSGPATALPATLQEQIDQECPAEFRRNGDAWRVPLPMVLDQDTDLFFNKEVSSNFFGGLVAEYCPGGHVLGIFLPEEQRELPPAPSVSHELVGKFWRATAKIWKWVRAMVERNEVIPLGVWVMEQIDGKEERCKATIRGCMEIDRNKPVRHISKASERSQKRAAEHENEGNQKRSRYA